jgi:hypothetical protein
VIQRIEIAYESNYPATYDPKKVRAWDACLKAAHILVPSDKVLSVRINGVVVAKRDE